MTTLHDIAEHLGCSIDTMTPYQHELAAAYIMAEEHAAAAAQAAAGCEGGVPSWPVDETGCRIDRPVPARTWRYDTAAKAWRVFCGIEMAPQPNNFGFSYSTPSRDGRDRWRIDPAVPAAVAATLRPPQPAKAAARSAAFARRDAAWEALLATSERNIEATAR